MSDMPTTSQTGGNMHDHGFKFFCSSSRTWELIPGRVYWVNLPIALDIPALRDNPLIAYRSIGDHPNSAAWTVAHKDTSAVICRARTRATAMEKAQSLLLSLGNDKFLRAIDMMRDTIKSLIST